MEQTKKSNNQPDGDSKVLDLVFKYYWEFYCIVSLNERIILQDWIVDHTLSKQ